MVALRDRITVKGPGRTFYFDGGSAAELRAREGAATSVADFTVPRHITINPVVGISDIPTPSSYFPVTAWPAAAPLLSTAAAGFTVSHSMSVKSSNDVPRMVSPRSGACAFCIRGASALFQTVT